MIKKMTKQVENVLKMMMAHTYKHLAMFPGTAMKSLLNFSFEIFAIFFFFFFSYVRKITRVWKQNGQ